MIRRVAQLFLHRISILIQLNIIVHHTTLIRWFTSCKILIEVQDNVKQNIVKITLIELNSKTILQHVKQRRRFN